MGTELGTIGARHDGYQRTNCQEHMVAKSRDPHKGVDWGTAQQTVSNISVANEVSF